MDGNSFSGAQLEHCREKQIMFRVLSFSSRIGLSTRHSVKGAKVEVQSAIDAQLMRCFDTPESIVRSWLIAEKESIIDVL